MKIACILSLLLTSCSSIQSISYKTSIGSSNGASEIYNDKSTQDMDLVHNNVKLNIPIHQYIELQVGTSFLKPLDGKNGVGITIDIGPKLLYKSGKFTPYFSGSIGPAITTEKWGGQETLWNFHIVGSIGLEYQISDDMSLLAEYSFIHISNGSKVFQHNYKNDSLNADVIGIGIKYSW